MKLFLTKHMIFGSSCEDNMRLKMGSVKSFAQMLLAGSTNEVSWQEVTSVA